MNPHQQASCENLSALLDGECTELEMRRLLKQLEQDPALRQRYQVLASSRAAMQVDTAAWAGCDISARVREVVDAEPFSRGAAGRFWQPLAQTAVAASVAVAVVLGVAYLPGQDAATNAGATNAAATFAAVPADGMAHTVSTGTAGAVAVPVAEPTVTHTVRASTVDLDRFESYVERHAEYASFNSNSGLMPFARVASFQRAE